MPPTPYDSCPCGSGKKFKWCCTPFFDKIELALEQQQQEQHDAALRTMEDLTKSHADVPQIWGYYAHILFAEGKTEQAEEAIRKAYSIQPDFAMGHLLRGFFRQSEGEIIGALLLFRKAADAYSPEATDQLAQVHELIARLELMLNRPVASRAALERVIKFMPQDGEARKQFDGLFGPESRMPEAARKKYLFRPSAAPIPAGADTGRLSDAKRAFEALSLRVAGDPATWFNLGVVRAWLGEQSSALEALNESLALETDDFRSEETAALIEVLKCGQGMEAEADYIEHRIGMEIRDPQLLSGLLTNWSQTGRLLGSQMSEDGASFSAMVVEELPMLLDTGTRLAKILCNMFVSGGAIRLWHVQKETVQKVATEIRDLVQLGVGEPIPSVGTVQFSEIGLEAVAYPLRNSQFEAAEGKMRDYAANFFENIWANRSFRSLGGITPLNAMSGGPLLRKRIIGQLKFLEDCMLGSSPRTQVGEQSVPMQIYDFNRIRSKLGIEMKAALPPVVEVLPEATPAPAMAAPVAAKPIAAPTPAAPAKREVTAMNAADLAALPIATITVGELEEAMRTAIKLGSHELAVAFAKAGSERPADNAKPDRYPFFACLMTGALAEGNATEAIRIADAGTTYDAAHNEGKRANEFGMRLATLYLKTQQPDAAAKEFDAAIERNPDDGNLFVKAAEAMLSAKNGTLASRFAERGMAKAKASGNRDLQGACGELLDAAKRYL